LLFLCFERPLSFLLKAFLIGIAPMLLQILTFYGTGETQFGARYLLDLIPLWVFVLFIKINNVSKKLFFILSFLSVVFCSLGAIWFACYKGW
jgi:hypothetical protein